MRFVLWPCHIRASYRAPTQHSRGQKALLALVSGGVVVVWGDGRHWGLNRFEVEHVSARWQAVPGDPQAEQDRLTIRLKHRDGRYVDLSGRANDQLLDYADRFLAEPFVSSLVEDPFGRGAWAEGSWNLAGQLSFSSSWGPVGRTCQVLLTAESVKIRVLGAQSRTATFGWEELEGLGVSSEALGIRVVGRVPDEAADHLKHTRGLALTTAAGSWVLTDHTAHDDDKLWTALSDYFNAHSMHEDLQGLLPTQNPVRSVS